MEIEQLIANNNSCRQLVNGNFIALPNNLSKTMKKFPLVLNLRKSYVNIQLDRNNIA